MKRNFRFLFIVVGLVSLSAISFAQRTPGIKLVEKDYTNNVTATDRFWFYLNSDGSIQNPLTGGGAYPGLEMDGNRAFQITKVVYVRGTDIQVSLKFQNESTVAAVGNLHINAARLIIDLPTNPPTQQLVNLGVPSASAISISPYPGTTTVNITLTNVPNYVAKGQLQINAVIYSNVGVQHAGEPGARSWGGPSWQDWETFYYTDATPVGLQSVPWTDLLDYSCLWAYGQTGEANVCHDLTFGLFWSKRWIYDPSGNYFWQDWMYGSNPHVIYNLFDALNSTSTVNMDCRDAAGFNTLCMASLGHSSTPIRLKVQIYPVFWTNPVCGMGNDASVDYNPISGAPTYVEHPFGFHQVTRISNGVYDAAVAQKFDLTGATYRNPPAHWVTAGYWQTQLGGSSLGLVAGALSPAFVPPPNYHNETITNINEIE
ncbi:MAG: hypothetical protein KF784_01785 [Fimbriimonadaceae bacterium]|nr:hypothetical protein [Fimbriimonadaceae bacterium]